ncbi:MAG TPA: ATPase [Thermoanaerobacterales bacterium]|jgi:F0F1-type ATP synthase membrane subunit b/b'|nr:ATPase [Thermoanaerobacterales bacterium]
MECYRIIEQIQDVISSGSKLPFSNKVILDQEILLELIDHLLRALPDDLKDAQSIVNDRQRILIDAQKEGEMIVKEAKNTIEQMVSQDEITKLAKEKSEQILTFAKQTAREIRVGATDFADEILQKAEENLSTLLETVKSGREELNQKR